MLIDGCLWGGVHDVAYAGAKYTVKKMLKHVLYAFTHHHSLL